MGDFPLLTRKVHGQRLIYLDNAATTQKPRQVLDAMRDYYEQRNANVHRGIYTLGVESTAAYDTARKRVAAFMNAPARQVIFTKGTTESINFVATAWGANRLKRGDEIVLTPQEHHANILPWQRVAHATGARLVYCDLTGDLRIDIADLKRRITDRTKLLAITHASNVLGTVTPLSEIIPHARERGVVTLVDGAQAAAHAQLDMESLTPDFYCFSGHKLLGPQGIGVLYMDERHLDMEPYQFGGDMIDDVRETDAEIATGEPRRFETGTPNVAGAVGLAAALDYLVAHPLDETLAAQAWDGLTQLGATLYGPRPGTAHIGVISFNLPGIHPHDVAQLLDERGIAIRAGQHCAHPLLHRIGVPATCRVSFACYNTPEDVQALLDGLRHVQEVFR